MGIRDQRIDWLRKRIWLTPFDVGGIGLVAEADDTLEAFSEADADYNEINSLGMAGVTLAAGKIISGGIRCPVDLDPKFPVGFRIGYIANVSSSAGTVSWILLQDSIAEGIVLAIATTALNTIIPLLDPIGDEAGVGSATDWLMQMSARGIRTDIGLTRAQIERCAYLTFSLEMDAVANVTTMHFLGLEMDYVPHRTQGHGTHIDCPLQSDGIN